MGLAPGEANGLGPWRDGGGRLLEGPRFVGPNGVGPRGGDPQRVVPRGGGWPQGVGPCGWALEGRPQ